MPKITIEQLAEKLQGKLWVKGDIKRIYLEEGYNTKKMSTKTYVYQREGGSFSVSCVIDCPSQHDNWITKEEDQIKDSVLQRIEKALAETVYLVVNEKDEYIDDCANVCKLNDIYGDFIYFKSKAESVVKEYEYKEFRVIEMPIEEFEAEVKRLDSIQASQKIEEPEKTLYLKTKVVKQPLTSYTVGKTYNHPKFGNGLLVSENDTTLTINFESAGEKQLLKEFTKLSEVND